MNGDWTMNFACRPGYNRQLVARVRAGVGVWLLILTAVLYGAGHGGWWESTLVLTAALHFYLAYRLRRSITASTDAVDRVTVAR